MDDSASGVVEEGPAAQRCRIGTRSSLRVRRPWRIVHSGQICSIASRAFDSRNVKELRLHGLMEAKDHAVSVGVLNKKTCVSCWRTTALVHGRVDCQAHQSLALAMSSAAAGRETSPVSLPS
eukprot:2573679-Pleurochrysis_carterae.AAC.1